MRMRRRIRGFLIMQISAAFLTREAVFFVYGLLV